MYTIYNPAPRPQACNNVSGDKHNKVQIFSLIFLMFILLKYLDDLLYTVLNVLAANDTYLVLIG